MSFNIPPVVEMDRLVLEKIKVASQGRIGPQMLHDMRMETWVEPMTDQMVLSLQSYVYAHKVDAQDVTVPFSKTENYTIPAPRRMLWTYGIVVALGVVLTLAAGSWPAFAVTAASALAWVVVYAANPPQRRSVTAKGEAVVHREQFNAFPDNGTVYPPSLGRSVQMAMVKNQYPRYVDDES
jgi:hypothetical protein